MLTKQRVCQSASEGPGKEKRWQRLRRAEAEWTGKQASLNGLANCVTGGVFYCQLSCDSQQPSPSNRACGVPSSARDGWLGQRLPGEKAASGSGEDGPRGLQLQVIQGGRGPLRYQVPTHTLILSQGCPLCPPWLLPVMYVLHTSVLHFHFSCHSLKISLFHSLLNN